MIDSDSKKKTRNRSDGDGVLRLLLDNTLEITLAHLIFIRVGLLNTKSSDCWQCFGLRVVVCYSVRELVLVLSECECV